MEMKLKVLALVATSIACGHLQAAEPDRPASLQTTPSAAVVVKDELDGSEIEALFSPDTNSGLRATAIQHAVKLAMAGDGRAAFDLGVLYRHGMDHPARAVEQNVETARYWLEKCVQSKNCPLFALVALAELELQAGNDKAAMQWAQAWRAIEQEIDKARKKPEPDAYAAYLLSRCFARMDGKDRDRLSSEWFAELLAKRGKQLDHMLAEQLKELPEREKNWIAFSQRKSRNVVTFRPTEVPTIALFLLRASPAGGRPEKVTLIEAFPKTGSLAGLPGVAGRLESKPYEVMDGGSRRYSFVPVAFNDPRYGLAPAKD
jgi:hypothetical protein